MKKVRIILLIIGSLVFVESIAFSQENEDILSLEDYKAGILHVGQSINKNGKADIKWLGSAFLVDEYCTFVTAKHIFKNAERDKIVIRFIIPDKKSKIRTVPIKIIYEDKNTDIAFLKIEKFRNQPCKSGNLYSFRLPSEYSKGSLVGEPVYIIGHPILEKKSKIDVPVVRKGIISSTELSWGRYPMILLDLIGVPGFSGSPVILEKTGEVIGIIYGPGPTQRRFGFEWATPITMEDYIIASSEKSVDDSNISRD